MISPSSALAFLECARCKGTADPDRPQTFCRCGGTFLARYGMAAAAATLSWDSVKNRDPGLWRWGEVLPVRDPSRRRGLGEGATPLIRVPELGEGLGISRLYLKDEGRNPGGSFKARGMAVAIARGAELEIEEFALPSAGNAGGAAAAYGAYWGRTVHVALPADTPPAFRQEAASHGASVYDVDGDIAQAGKWLAERPEAGGWFFLSTLKEPYRVEGKKTMGYELVEQFGGRWPEIVIYPTGGGTGIVGMAKADAELRTLNMIQGPPPRFVVVQAEGCAPLVHAFRHGHAHAKPWPEPRTRAFGLRVPGTIGDHLILETLRRTGGTAVTVSDPEMESARRVLARETGVFACPEAAATVVAARNLRDSGWIKPEDDVVLFITGNGFKYPLEETR